MGTSAKQWEVLLFEQLFDPIHYSLIVVCIKDDFLPLTLVV